MSEKLNMTCPQCGWRAAVPSGWLPPEARRRDEAVKLAEQWQDRADDVGRLSRAVLGIGEGK